MFITKTSAPTRGPSRYLGTYSDLSEHQGPREWRGRGIRCERECFETSPTQDGQTLLQLTRMP